MLVGAIAGCVTADGIRRAEEHDRRCWANYRRLVSYGSSGIEDDIQIERKRRTCEGDDRRLAEMTDEYEGGSQGDGSGSRAAAAFFSGASGFFGGALAGARAVPSQPTTTCESTRIGAYVSTTCRQQ